MSAFGAMKGAGTIVAKAFVVTVAMAVVMMLIAFGFMYLFSPQMSIPVSMAVILVVFALSFVASAVLLDRAGTGQVQSLIAGAVVALGITVLVLTAGCGVYYVQQGMLALDLETLLVGFAVALIASVVIDRLILKI